MINPEKQHQIIEAEEYITVRLVGMLIPETITAFEADLPQMVKPTHHVIIQCSHLSGMAKQWVRPLMNLERGLTNQNRKLRLIDVKEDVASFFKNEGVDSAFVVKRNLRDALSSMGITVKKVLDTDFINPFLAATMRVLEVQCQTKTSPGKLYLKKPGDKFTGDISGVIGLVSEAFSGSVFISFPEKTFLSVMTRMFGEPQTQLTKEIEDGAAELTNIIFGQAKIILNEKGYGIKTALPSVITGKDHAVASTTKSVTVVVPFSSDAGDFYVEISTSI
jgi:chemotaxis protein CheX